MSVVKDLKQLELLCAAEMNGIYETMMEDYGGFLKH